MNSRQITQRVRARTNALRDRCLKEEHIKECLANLEPTLAERQSRAEAIFQSNGVDWRLVRERNKDERR